MPRLRTIFPILAVLLLVGGYVHAKAPHGGRDAFARKAECAALGREYHRQFIAGLPEGQAAEPRYRYHPELRTCLYAGGVTEDLKELPGWTGGLDAPRRTRSFILDLHENRVLAEMTKRWTMRELSSSDSRHHRTTEEEIAYRAQQAVLMGE